MILITFKMFIAIRYIFRVHGYSQLLLRTPLSFCTFGTNTIYLFPYHNRLSTSDLSFRLIAKTVVEKYTYQRRGERALSSLKTRYRLRIRYV